MGKFYNMYKVLSAISDLRCLIPLVNCTAGDRDTETRS